MNRITRHGGQLSLAWLAAQYWDERHFQRATVQTQNTENQCPETSNQTQNREKHYPKKRNSEIYVLRHRIKQKIEVRRAMPERNHFFSKRCSLTEWGKYFLKCTELFHFQLCAKIILFYGPFVIHVVRCAGQLWWQTGQLQSSSLVLAKSTEPSKARSLWVDKLWCRVEYERLHAE